MMTKKIFLAWKLPQLPTGSDVASLVEQKVISANEARQILFGEREEAHGGTVGTNMTYVTSNGNSTVSFTIPPKNITKPSDKTS